MADSAGTNLEAGAPPDPTKKSGAIVHVRADSDSTMNEMFAVVENPGSSNTPLSIPYKLRNLPPSFFNPPMPRSPAHSREGSTVSNHDGNSIQDPFSPAPKSVGSPQPQQQPGQPQLQPPNHNRSQSAPVELGVHVQSVQQNLHLRQPSYDVSGGNNTHSNLGPLPPGWEPARTPTGQIYFMNHITKTTQWEDPRQQVQQQIRAERVQQQLQQQRGSPQPSIQASNNNGTPNQGATGPLPQGWEQSVTPEGEVYFINHVSKTTSWFDPRIPINSQSVPIRQQQGPQGLLPQGGSLVMQAAGPGQHNVGPGMTAAQKRQQDIRLQRLENERRVLQARQAELKKFMADKQQQEHLRQQQNVQQEKMLNTTQEMLMRQNLNDTPASASGQVMGGMDPFLSTGQQQVQAVQQQANELHNRQESADSGLGMGSNFNLGSIPEDDMPMDTTDLDTTLTDNTNNVPPGTTVLMNNAGGAQQAAAPVEDHLISSLSGDISNLGDGNELMLNDILDARQGQWI